MKILINHSGVDPADPALLAAAPEATFVATPDEATLRREGVDADVCFGTVRLRELLEVAGKLRWVAGVSAGQERNVRLLDGRDEVTLTSGAGTYDRPITEHLLALLLALRREVHLSVRQAMERHWEPRRALPEIHGSTLGIVGLGHIGRQLARAAHRGFDMTVLACKRRPVEPEPDIEQVYYGREGLLAMLPRCDAVAVTSALTPDTRRLLDGEALDRLPPHAVVLNIGRGPIIDEAALIERLCDGRLCGAGLDVFETEPLPHHSPLWTLPNVIVTAHHAGSSLRIGERQLELFCRQLRKWVAGQPLDNVVDRQAGY